MAPATPQGWCQFGVVHAWIRKEPVRVLVGLCVSTGICNQGMFSGHASPSSSVQVSVLLLPGSERMNSNCDCAAGGFQQGSLAMKSPSCSSVGVRKAGDCQDCSGGTDGFEVEAALVSCSCRELRRAPCLRRGHFLQSQPLLHTATSELQPGRASPSTRGFFHLVTLAVFPSIPLALCSAYTRSL